MLPDVGGRVAVWELPQDLTDGPIDRPTAFGIARHHLLGDTPEKALPYAADCLLHLYEQGEYRRTVRLEWVLLREVPLLRWSVPRKSAGTNSCRFWWML